MLADGQIAVNTKDKAPVTLILNGVTLSNASSAPIYIMEAKEAIIVLADGSKNSVTDGKSYVYANAAEDEPNAAIFSKADLTITGGGALTVSGNFNDGIASKDGLTIVGGTLAVQSADDGIRGKDFLIVKGGNIAVNAGGDGLKSDNTEDATLGYVSIENGVLKVTSGGDAIAAETDATIRAGTLTLSAGGGYKASLAADTSAKGIKGVASVVIDGGTFTIDSADDAIHSNDRIEVNGGTFAIATGDDGIHADTALTINGGDIRITNSYEGIESAVITINDGDIRLVSSDDALNVAGGTGGGGMPPGAGGRPGRPGGPGQDAFTYTGKQFLYINGGNVTIEAGGDGIDVNGAITMTDGVVIVNGPIQQMNSALDYDAFFNITGGFLVAAGSAGMAQAPGAASSQNSLLLNFSGAQKAGTLVHIQTSAGKDVLTFAPSKQFQSIAFSSPALITGATYDVFTGGSSTGTPQDGLYRGGIYAPGAKYTSFTISSPVTAIGARVR
ncbi:MAG: carbohydrate-binding domain-containing protein [Anaerolineae bacterium]|nr:carbohydrate-binding domain-containing protein [Anaerolineae bacterium]